MRRRDSARTRVSSGRHASHREHSAEAAPSGEDETWAVNDEHPRQLDGGVREYGAC
jgi:hypothetical protein